MLALIAGCASSDPGTRVASSSSKEYFPESKYGVKASPRVTDKRSRLPRGGGREQLGKPYKVAGRWYYPKEDQDYRKRGFASWYGDAFHGRLTANGEIYDMTHLTAAHPTMPLPSYARVTNLENGSSIIVRVNDRGPFHRGRIIDLSRRAADLLGYTGKGVAHVEVEYVGRAPLHGQDEAYLIASYRPGGQAPGPADDGLPPGVMIAMNGPTPSVPGSRQVPQAEPAQPQAPVMTVASAALSPMAGVQPAVSASAPQPVPFAVRVAGDPVLPETGPALPDRPLPALTVTAPDRGPRLLGYWDQRIAEAAGALDRLAVGSMSAEDIAASFRRMRGEGVATPPPAGDYVAIGTFRSLGEARRAAEALSDLGRITIERDAVDGVHSVMLASDGRLDTDTLLREAWAHGVSDAFIIRY
jgi:rare lipoprotein A